MISHEEVGGTERERERERQTHMYVCIHIQTSNYPEVYLLYILYSMQRQKLRTLSGWS